MFCMYITKEIHACIMYVSYIQLFYAITKKSYIIATKENGWRLEIKGENVLGWFITYSVLSKVQKIFVPGCFPIHMDSLTSPSEKN